MPRHPSHPLLTPPTEVIPRSRHERWLAWYLGAAATASVVLWALLAQLPYWIDEVFSITFVSRPLPDVVRYVATDIHPPLYFLLLHGWVQLFGPSPLATAWLSLAFHALAGWLLYRLAQTLFDRPTARLTLLLGTSSFFLTFYATETRMYSLLLFTSLGATLAFYRIVRQPADRRAWRWYLIATVAGAYTHYLSWLVVFSHHLTVLLLRWRRRTTLPWRPWLAVHGLAVALFLPWLPVMLPRLAVKAAQLSWMNGFSLGQRLLTFAVDGLIPLNPIFNFWDLLPRLAWWLLGALAAVLLVTNVRLRRGELGFRHRPLTTPVLFLAPLIILPPLVGNLFGAWYPRYFLGSVALLLVVFARWLRRPQLDRVRGVLVGVALFFIITENFRQFLGTYRYDVAFRWPDVAASLTTAARTPGEIIYFATNEERLQFRHTYRGAAPVASFLPIAHRRGDPELDRVRLGALPVVTRQNVGDAAVDLRGFAAVWQVRGPLTKLLDPEQLIARWLEERCQADETIVFPGIPGIPEWQEIFATRWTNCSWTSPAAPQRRPR